MGFELHGNFKVGTQNYFVIFKDNKSSQRLTLLSAYPKNLMPGSDYETSYRNWNEIRRGIVPEDYVVCSIDKQKSSNKVKYYGVLKEGLSFFNALRTLNTYSFKKENILRDTRTVESGINVERFRAVDSKYNFTKELEDKLYTKVEGSYGNTSLALAVQQGFNLRIKVELNKLEDIQTLEYVNLVTLKSVGFEDLKNLVDLSWFWNEKTGECYKHYYVIKNPFEFESIAMRGIIQEIRRCLKTGEEFKLVLDTETTGLNVYYLSQDNPLKSTVVAIPLGWAKNTSCVIFIDMEYFDNISMKYVADRIKNLVEVGGDITIEERQFPNPNMYDELLLDPKNYTVVDSVTIQRSFINLIGHNTPFDGRVLLDSNLKPYWNNDTLQMGFNLNPKVGKGAIQVLRKEEQEDGTTKEFVESVKGGVSLKNLTRRLFGHETPELSDILGKGSEDKFRYLSDEKVAMIYGCADADYPAAVYDEIRRLMSDKMYSTYQKQDMPLINILYEAEYYGLTIHEEKVKALAQQSHDDLEVIKKFLWNYVGRKIGYKRAVSRLTIEFKSALGSAQTEEQKKKIKDTFAEAKQKIHIDKNEEYQFEMKAADLRKVLFEILEYPIIAYTESENNPLPATNKFVMKKLMSAKLSHNELTEDIVGSDGKTVLIEAKEFNKYRYPIAYVLSIYGAMNKEYTSYFKPIRDNNLEGRLFKNFSMARIETRRIMNPSQTMKGSLKALTLPFDGGKDYYMLDFDMAQVEYRIMVSLAWLLLLEKHPGKTKEEIFAVEEGAESVYNMIENLKHPEADFHTESAAKITHQEPYQIDKKFRKKMKSVHFGIPYGLGERSLCESMFGEATEKNLIETRQILASFKQANKPVIDMLEHVRDESFKSIPFSDDFKRFAGFVDYTVDEETGEITEHLHSVGRVQNLMGFYRLFDLEDMDKRKEGIIRRAAGNYPIQSFAAELFRIILIKFYNRCVKEGIADKVKWHMLIHDELLCSVHKSLNPFYIYKLILEECMPTFPGHTNYYVGINIGDNWAECKDDMSEAPVLFVQRMVERWDKGEFLNDTWVDNAKEYVNKYKDEYMVERVHELVEEIQPDIDNPSTIIDSELIIDNLTNYTVRGYLNDMFIPIKYSKKYGSATKEWKNASDDFKFEEGLLSWAGQKYGDGKSFKRLDGTFTKSHFENLRTRETNESIDDLELIIEDDNDLENQYNNEVDWGFDEDGFNQYSNALYFDNYSFDTEDKDKIEYDFSNKNARDVTELIKFKEVKDTYASIINNSVVINIKDNSLVQEVLQHLKQFIVNKRNGIPGIIKGNKGKLIFIDGFIDKHIDIDALDSYICSLHKTDKLIDISGCKHLTLKGNTLIINVKNSYISDKVVKGMAKYKSSKGLHGMLQVDGKLVHQFLYIDKSIDLKRLDSYITSQTELSVKSTKPLEYVHLMNSMVVIDVADVIQMQQVKNLLQRYQANAGSIVKFRIANKSSTLWSRIRTDINFIKLDDYIRRAQHEAIR